MAVVVRAVPTSPAGPAALLRQGRPDDGRAVRVLANVRRELVERPYQVRPGVGVVETAVRRAVPNDASVVSGGGAAEREEAQRPERFAGRGGTRG